MFRTRRRPTTTPLYPARVGTSSEIRLRRVAWLVGTAVVATSAAIASALPDHGRPLVPRFSSPSPATLFADLSDLLETARPVAPAALQHVHAVSLANRPKEAGAAHGLSSFAASTNPVRASHAIPGLGLAIRTQFVSDLQNLFFRPSREPDLRLTPMTPPYASSGSGHFEVRLAYVTARIERSLFEAGQEAGLPEPLIVKLAEIFGWDIDFALGVHSGDSFGVIYEQRYWLGRKISDGPILAAEFSSRGQFYRAIAFRGENGTIGYYTPTGRNLKRPFLRTPVKFSRVSSRFSKSRYHPILKLWRAHNGVDYAAPPGTPVLATAEGRITWLGRNGGYGNMVVLDHGGDYSTLYGHLSGFPANLKAGQHVGQGDIIGYVGKTGLATGPHLHYEFRVNGRHKNPLTFELPAGDAIDPAEHENFLRVAREWVTQLQLIGARHLAAAAYR